MSNYDLVQRDKEYQKEIRRRKLTDAAKIGLLVNQNIQQFQTNQLLEQLQYQACHTNQFLNQISGTLDQIAKAQATHLEQVQRERSLKEILFQFEKYLKETEAYGDPVAAAFGMNRLLQIIDRPGNGFSTADLSDLNDKRHFDAMMTKAKAILTQLPPDQFQELQNFEYLVGVYHQRKARGFDPVRDVPLKERLNLPKTYRTPPKPSANNVTKLGDGKSVAKAGCGGLLVLFNLPLLLGSIVSLTSNEPMPFNVIIISLAITAAGIALLWQFIQGLEVNKQQKREMQNQQQMELKQWEAQRNKEQIKLNNTNKKIDAENSDIEKKRQQAARIYQATMDDMRNLINGFLMKHPMIEKYVARV
ncbi:hypothetical protein [Gimesia chilikensis]|uniref:Uncharacterized protein n=1 Tax=Gimesia chilikensis TaxID=2605989 RepID=A0A517PYD2_9PLAN|nr:hypothetical protein [Gimesia chilikensis]QDT24398.1 hypothetical protein HG66A1_62300 [Gimesia chilikensis]